MPLFAIQMAIVTMRLVEDRANASGMIPVQQLVGVIGTLILAAAVVVRQQVAILGSIVQKEKCVMADDVFSVGVMTDNIAVALITDRLRGICKSTRKPAPAASKVRYMIQRAC